MGAAHAHSHDPDGGSRTWPKPSLDLNPLFRWQLTTRRPRSSPIVEAAADLEVLKAVEVRTPGRPGASGPANRKISWPPQTGERRARTFGGARAASPQALTERGRILGGTRSPGSRWRIRHRFRCPGFVIGARHPIGTLIISRTFFTSMGWETDRDWSTMVLLTLNF